MDDDDSDDGDGSDAGHGLVRLMTLVTLSVNDDVVADAVSVHARKYPSIGVSASTVYWIDRHVHADNLRLRYHDHRSSSASGNGYNAHVGLGLSLDLDLDPGLCLGYGLDQTCDFVCCCPRQRRGIWTSYDAYDSRLLPLSV